MLANIPKKKASHAKPINAAVSLLMAMLPAIQRGADMG